VTARLPLDSLLDATVRVDGEHVGSVVGIVLDRPPERLLGLEVATPDSRRLFLPWVAAEAHGHVVDAVSSLVLIELDDVETYAQLGATILRLPRELEGLTVGDAGAVLGWPAGLLASSA
jgi:hypothetical protein